MLRISHVFLLITLFFLVSGCITSISTTNQLNPGMRPNEVRTVMGEPSQTQFIGNKMIWKYSLHQPWEGFVPYYLIFKKEDQRLEAWYAEGEYIPLYPDSEQAEPPKVVKQVPAPPASINHGNLKKVKLTGEYRYTYGDNESLVGAKTTCQSMAVRNALESYKTFVTATSEVKDFQLKEDLIKSVSASYVEDLKLLEEEINGRTIYIKVEGYIVPEILDMALTAEVQRLQAK